MNLATKMLFRSGLSKNKFNSLYDLYLLSNLKIYLKDSTSGIHSSTFKNEFINTDAF